MSDFTDEWLAENGYVVIRTTHHKMVASERWGNPALSLTETRWVRGEGALRCTVIVREVPAHNRGAWPVPYRREVEVISNSAGCILPSGG